MGKASYAVKEIRFVMEDELTQAYWFLEAHGDCPVNVQGWHHKTFPASVPCIDILKGCLEDDPVMWSLEAPENEDQG